MLEIIDEKEEVKSERTEEINDNTPNQSITDRLSRSHQREEFENQDKQAENNIINLRGRIVKVFKNKNAKK